MTEEEKKKRNRDWSKRKQVLTSPDGDNPLVIGNSYTLRDGANKMFTGKYVGGENDKLRFDGGNGMIREYNNLSNLYGSQEVYDYDDAYDELSSGAWEYPEEDGESANAQAHQKSVEPDELRKEETFPDESGGADVNEPTIPSKQNDNSSESYGQAQAESYMEKSGVNQSISDVDSTPSVSQNAENVANNGENTSGSENSEVNNFAVSSDNSVYNGKVDFLHPGETTETTEQTEQVLGDNNKAEAQARQYDNKGLKAMRQGVSTEEDAPYGVSKSGDAYISDNKGVQLLQDVGAVNSADLEKQKQAYLSGAPEAVTKEEEDRIIRGMQTARSIGAFGALLSALANVFGTSKGAVSETIPEYKSIDYEALREKYRKGRDARNKYIAGWDAYKTEQELKKQKAELDRDKFETEKVYNKARTEYNYWQAELKKIQAKYADGHGGITPKEDAQLQNAVDKLNQAKERMEEAERHHRVMEGIASYNSTTSRMNADTNKAKANVYISRNGGSGGSDITIVVPERTGSDGKTYGGYHYNIAEKTYIKNVYTMAEKLGIPTTTTDDYGKTTRRDVNDISKEVIANWNGDCDAIIQNAIKGDVQQNKTETKTETKAETPKEEKKSGSSNANGSSSSNSGTSGGSVWGNSITRKKKK